nr:hypothetical protein GCM10010200_095830 [Actinomadura rugatobispora]
MWDRVVAAFHQDPSVTGDPRGPQGPRIAVHPQRQVLRLKTDSRTGSTGRTVDGAAEGEQHTLTQTEEQPGLPTTNDLRGIATDGRDTGQDVVTGGRVAAEASPGGDSSQSRWGQDLAAAAREGALAVWSGGAGERVAPYGAGTRALGGADAV